MKIRILLGVLAVVVPFGMNARAQTYQSHIEHPIVRYRISARYDPATRKIAGHYNLVWWNHTADSVPDLYFHLYLNAFKNMDSTFLRESSISRRSELLKEWKSAREGEKWGWVEVNKLQVVGGADLTAGAAFVHPDDDNAADQTVIRVPLPQPIPPHGSIELSVDFTSKLPRALARTGYDGDYILAGQWFPKIGVYEATGERGRKESGWNCHQFHTNTEFYADYGTWDVDLTVPSNYVVGATGFLRRTESNPDQTTTYHFYQEDVHDFAWTASPHFIKLTRTFNWKREVRADEVATWARIFALPPDHVALRDVSVTLLVQPEHRGIADRYFLSAFNGLKYFGLWYGQYPYDTLTVVDPPRHSQTGGMEYPTFITGGAYFWPGENSLDPAAVTVHEFGHQFWYGLVGNNEFEEAWLDEGFNTYSTGKVLETAYPRACNYGMVAGMPVPLYPWFSVEVPQFPFAGVGSIPLGSYYSSVQSPQRTNRRPQYFASAKSDDLVRFGWQYLDGESYVTNSYARPGLVLRTLESYLGPETMARVMRTYQQRWRYRHPCTRDFIDVANEVSGQRLEWFFDQFFYTSNAVDFEISDIRNELVDGKVGVYNEGGRKVTYLEQDAARAAEKSKNKVYRSTVVVRRMGEVTVPVDVAIHFSDGETVSRVWDGKYRWVKYEFEKPTKVVSAEVDPQRKLALSENFTAGSRTTEPDNRAATKWYIRWLFWIENLFFAAGFFS